MKNLQLAFIIILIFAFSGITCIAENSQKKGSVLKDDTNETNIFSKSLEDSIKKENRLPKANFSDRWNNLLQSYVSENGKVNYRGFKTNWEDLRSYIKSLSRNIPNETNSKEEKLAYWINAYNAMTIDLILRNYPLKSIKDIKDPWEQRLWKLENKWYNLNEIEHQVLRKMNEPRIHFAIVCASYSCPKLQNETFTAADLDSQLTSVTIAFLNDPERNSISENSLELSKIFQWFAKDFKQNGSLINFLNQYSDIKISDKAKKSFKDYNWALNE
jgi:ribosomal protein S18